ncbi:MAG: CPBP family intramembrane metalloprotease [Firmicutes bacterium]|nr:CPBP family intramembrane metalloprotease [Bacillota bacterium]
MVVIIYLTFSLTLNSRLFQFVETYHKGLGGTLRKYSFQIWCGSILVAGLVGRNTFKLVAPKLTVQPAELVIVLLALIPFMLSSGYQPRKDFKGLARFCLVFPIVEEILFRGIILQLGTYLVGSGTFYIPVPILKGVTVQVFLSAICFSLTHLQYFAFKVDFGVVKRLLFALLFGLFAGNLVEVTGSILYPVVFHVLANTGATLYFLRFSGKNKLQNI